MADPPANNRLPAGKACNRKIFRLVAAALSLHVTTVLAMSVMGAAAVVPNTIDSNGIGISFAIDGLTYRVDAAELAEILRHRRFMNWITYPAPFHAKLYSLSFAVFDPWSDFSILSAEPANALIYLLIIGLVFKIGEELCNRRVGILAAGIVAFWPSFFLFSTQLLKDPQFIAAMLAMILICIRSLTRIYSWRRSIPLAVSSGLIITVLWLMRGEGWELTTGILLVALALLVIRQLHEKKILVGNTLVMISLLMTAAIIPRVVSPYEPSNPQWAELLAAPPGVAEEPPGESLGRLPARISLIRHRFIRRYQSAGANIDTDVEFATKTAIIRYLPRAAVIGFFAPFPDMWFVRGRQVGLTGRLLSGFETAVMYVIEFLAVIGLWRRRRQLSAWLVATVCIVGVTSIGVVVVNASAIYRLRYSFLMLMVVLGADGGIRVFTLLSAKKFFRKAISLSV